MEREGAMAVKWKAEWRIEEGEKGGKNSQGKERRCGKEGGWMRFSQAANMLSRSTTLNNVMAGSQQKHLYNIEQSNIIIFVNFLHIFLYPPPRLGYFALVANCESNN